MSRAASPFAEFDLGPVDQIAIAVRQILLAQQKLREWTNGNVMRSETLSTPAGITPPCIVIGSLSCQPIFSPNGEIELAVPVHIDITWFQPVAWMDDDEPSIDGIRAYIASALTQNYYLKVPQFGMRRLVHRVHEFRPIDYSTVGDVDGSGRALLHFSMVVEYRLHVNARTHELITEEVS